MYHVETMTDLPKRAGRVHQGWVTRSSHFSRSAAVIVMNDLRSRGWRADEVRVVDGDGDRVVAGAGAHATKNSSERHNEWRLRQIILPEEVRHRVEDWHGGQGSATYRIVSIGYKHLVSLSMIDRALLELERELRMDERPAHGLSGRSRMSRSERQSLEGTAGELAAVRAFWREHSAKEAGLEEHDEGYDELDYGLTAEEEREIKTRSG